MEKTPEQKKKQTELIAKVVIAGLVCFAVAPVIWTVVGGAVGIIVAGAIGFTTLQLTPYLAMKVANARMKLITNEARKNPIETMNNIYLENMATLDQKKTKIVQFEGRLGVFQDKMVEFGKKYPDEVANYKKIADKMSSVLVRQKQKQKAAYQAAKLYHDQIEKAEAIYAMALEAHAVTELAGSIEKQVFQDIKKRVAFDAVTHSFNTAVAELSFEADTDPDSFLLESDQTKSLTEGSSTPLPKAKVIDAELVQ